MTSVCTVRALISLPSRATQTNTQTGMIQTGESLASLVLSLPISLMPTVLANTKEDLHPSPMEFIFVTALWQTLGPCQDIRAGGKTIKSLLFLMKDKLIQLMQCIIPYESC